MSFFKEMLKSRSNFSTYTWIVNSLGEVVVYSLGPDGKAIAFASDDAFEMMKSIIEASGEYQVIFTPTPDLFMDGGENHTWEEVLGVLNGERDTTGRRYARNAHRVIHRTLGWEKFKAWTPYDWDYSPKVLFYLKGKKR